MEEQIITTIQKLLDSGALDNLEQPGAQALFIYALLILLAVLSFKIFIMNGSVKRFFDMQEIKIKQLEDLNTKLGTIQQDIGREHNRISDVLNLLHAKRHSDKIESR